MPSDQQTPKPVANSPGSSEPKARGANRSTKVAGKLKVLPEEPEPVSPRAVDLPGPPRNDHDENIGTTGSDEGNVDDDDDEEQEDVEVNLLKSIYWIYCS